MWVKKIIYVTNWERDHNWLTSVATSQLKKVVNNVLEGEVGDSTKFFRTTDEMSPLTGDTLSYLSNNVRNITQDSWENLYLNFISNPWDIQEVIDSTKRWEIAVVGITQKELKILLETLKKQWYNVIDKSKINHWYNVYAVTIDPVNKEKSDFFVARWGEL